MTTEHIITRIESGDRVVMRGTTYLGTVDAVRTIGPSGHVADQVYWGISVRWDDRGSMLPTWHSYASVDLVSKS